MPWLMEQTVKCTWLYWKCEVNWSYKNGSESVNVQSTHQNQIDLLHILPLAVFEALTCTQMEKRWLQKIDILNWDQNPTSNAKVKKKSLVFKNTLLKLKLYARRK